MNRPWIKFWTDSFLGDARLSACPLELQGLWFRMIAVLAQCPDYGVAADARGPWDDATILRSCGVTDPCGLQMLHELLSREVLARNQSGAIFSRYMVRDAATRGLAKKRQSVHRSRDGPSSVTRDNRVTGPLLEVRGQNKSQKPVGNSPTAAQTPQKTEQEQRRIVAARDARIEREQEVNKELSIGSGPSSVAWMPAAPGSKLDQARRRYAEQSGNRAASRPQVG